MAVFLAAAHRAIIAAKVKADAEGGDGSAKLSVYDADDVLLATQDVTLSELGAGALEAYEFNATDLPQVPDALATGTVSYAQLEDSDGTMVVQITGLSGSTVDGEPFAFKDFKYTAN